MNAILDTIKNIIKENQNIVLISGLEVMKETGLNGVRAEHIAYDIEQKYGYANDDIISSLFFARRVELFYRYYQEVILNKEKLIPTGVHRGVRKLQEEGKMGSVITGTVYSLFQKAGCEQVIEMHGSAEKNKCPVCGKIFNSDYIRRAKGVPKCDECEITLRPGFSLLGEMIDNGKITKASNAVEGADVLLIAGAPLNSPLCHHLIRYYNGNRMILLNIKETTGDELADYRAYGNLSEMFSYITDF